MPIRTIKRAAIGQTYVVSSCLLGIIADSCYATPGAAFPEPVGSWFSDTTHLWEADVDFATTSTYAFNPGHQVPVHVRTMGTDEKTRDPYNGVDTSRVITSFGYGAYGNVTGTTADTYTGSGGSPVATLITTNTYGRDNPSLWRLGRLTQSTVTRRRPGRPDVVRTTSFDYSMSGAATGLLTAERTQPGGTADQALLREYTIDEFGNRTLVQTCAAPATDCDATIAFHPATLTSVERYTRTVYDNIGRYPIATYEPFWSDGGGTEVLTQAVYNRDVFGNVTYAADLNGVRTLATPGAFGRAHYTWRQTVPGATLGEPAHGAESWTTYRWCTQVSCPAGAKFRQRTISEGAPTTWTYFDVLGRPILTATETFNIGVSGKDVSAICTKYDVTGKPKQVSNPFFLDGVAGPDGPTGLDGVCTSSARLWTTTFYDVLGRPTDVATPDASQPNGVAIRSTTYTGNTTVHVDARGKRKTEVRNGKGELISVTDHVGFTTTYQYHADGSTHLVERDAGRGVIRNAFTYDALGRKIQQTDPDAGVTNYQYNALGELVAQIDSSGNRIENEYDARGRVWRRTVRRANGSIESQSTFTFDTAPGGLGQLAKEAITGTYSDWATLAASNAQYRLSFIKDYTYDALGRPVDTTTAIDGVAYYTSVQYDALGRAWKAKDASGRWAKTLYNTRGMAIAVCSSSGTDAATSCPANSNTYLETLETDAWGHVIRERRGNSAAMEVTRAYKPDTGRIWSICAGSTACNLVSETYGWDANGNLHSHQKENRYLETFQYDDLNRLRTATLAMVDGTAVNQIAQSFEYDALGNICRAYKLGTSRVYTYRGLAGCGLGDARNSAWGGAAGGAVGPHQVSSVNHPPSNPPLSSPPYTYSYDAQGNQIQQYYADAGGDRYVHYSIDGKPYEIGTDSRDNATAGTRFWYGSNGQRYKRVDIATGRKILYLGNVEIVSGGGTATTYRRTVAGVMLQTIVSGTGTNHYLFHDHLGNLVKITNASGAPISSTDFAAFGERRNYDEPDRKVYSSPSLTERGFTGQEHIDAGDLIHFNARLYDPFTGRFLQPDPLIQAPDDPQSWNAYTYVFNNPLVYTDPTGMLGQRERQWLAAIISIVYTVVTWDVGGGFSIYGMLGAIGVGFVTGAIATQSWEGALRGALIGGLTYGVGWATSGLDPYLQVGARALSGGVVESLSGGSFGNGFVAAGLTALAMPAVGRIGNDVARVAVGALVGGTISELTGGKFANGAVQAGVLAAMHGRSSQEELNASQGGERQYETEEPQGLVELKRKYPGLARRMDEQWQASYEGSFRREHGFVALENAEGTQMVYFDLKAEWSWSPGGLGYKKIPVVGPHWAKRLAAAGITDDWSIRVIFHTHPFDRCFAVCGPNSGGYGPSAGDQQIARLIRGAFHVVRQQHQPRVDGIPTYRDLYYGENP